VRAHLPRLARYLAGSVVAGVVSVTTFALLYGALAVAGPVTASVVAWVAGAVPNYHLNRRWAWGRRGRSDVRREVLPYAATAAASVVLSSAATSAADAWVPRLVDDRELVVALVVAAYALTYGGLFVAKYVVLDRWLFGSRRRSRHQVPSTTRA
jgi:putative flippase GtrA